MADQNDSIATAIKLLAIAILVHAVVTSPLVTLAVTYALMPQVSATPPGMPGNHMDLVHQEQAKTLFPLIIFAGVVVLFGLVAYGCGIWVMKRRKS
jgi:hypothetical protein